MQLIDTHCHLDDDRFDHDRLEVVERAAQAGAQRLIVPSVYEERWQKVSEISHQRESIYPAFGMHPWFCERHTLEELKRLEVYLKHAIAVGECGLDFGKGRASEAEQLKWLRPQLELAVENDLPVILHTFKSLDRLCIELRSFPGLRGVFHSFSGSQQQADRILDAGFYLGVGGGITRPNADRLREMITALPIERLLLETDAPDQSPVAHQGRRNEPAFLVEIVHELATMRGLSAAELADVTTKNARELFSI